MSSTSATPTSSLGSPCNFGLPALKAVELHPNVRSKPISIEESLLRIESVHAVKIPGQDTTSEKDPFYEIGLFHHRHQGPIVVGKTNTSACESNDSPDVRTVRRASEIATLRDKIHLCIKPLPRGESCPFCSQLTDFLTYSSVRPAVFVHAVKTPAQDASPLFTSFLQRVLEDYQGRLQAGRTASCRGERHVICILHLFLQPTHP